MQRERWERGRDVVYHERLARIGRFERLQEAERRERRLAFDEARRVREMRRVICSRRPHHSANLDVPLETAATFAAEPRG